MRIETLTHRRGWLSLAAFALLSALSGLSACNEADGTDMVPGAYPPAAEIDYPDPPPEGGDGDGDGDTTVDSGTPDDEDAG